MGRTQKQITLNRFSDVVGLNAFIATHLARARLVYITSKLTGLWQLDLISKKNRWTIGHYIDGLEDRSIEYDIALQKVLDGYVDEELDKKLHYPPYVLWLRGGLIFITLPHEPDAEIVITAPQVCERADPLREPVYIWRDSASRFNILSCVEGFYVFQTREEFENWVRSAADYEKTKVPTMRWANWFVVPGTVSGGDEWPAVVRRAVRGNFIPTPDDVIELVRKYDR